MAGSFGCGSVPDHRVVIKSSEDFLLDVHTLSVLGSSADTYSCTVYYTIIDLVLYELRRPRINTQSMLDAE